MSCACGKTKRKEKEIARSKKIRAGSIPTVSLTVLKSRRSICRNCKHATKNPHPKFTAFGGLTSQSSCKLSKRKLNECLKDPDYACPAKLFDCES